MCHCFATPTETKGYLDILQIAVDLCLGLYALKVEIVVGETLINTIALFTLKYSLHSTVCLHLY